MTKESAQYPLYVPKYDDISRKNPEYSQRSENINFDTIQDDMITMNMSTNIPR
jgi:hypothetical protein